MMRGVKQHAVLFILLAVTVLILCFIFHNSLQDSTASNTRSGQIAEKIKPVLDPQNTVTEELFHKITRKMAHFLEFGLLGVSAALLAMHISAAYVRCSVFAPLFFILLSAVTDEFIQSFTGRTSSVSDVLIDFSGAGLGILLVYGIVHILCLILRKTQKRKHHAD